MTEAEWLAGTDPFAMLCHIGNRGSDRKFRLFACACHRRSPNMADSRVTAAVEVVEKYADGSASAADLHAIARSASPLNVSVSDDPAGTLAVWDLTDEDSMLAAGSGVDAVERLVAATYMRCVFGHPFHPDQPRKAGWLRVIGTGLVSIFAGSPVRPTAGKEPWPPLPVVAFAPSWLTSTVVQLAEGIYADRAFDRLPILADALQDAGCEDADILAHCRGDGPHVRGCWVVDLVLGKS